MNNIKDFLHRTIMHYAFWYNETERQFGREIAFEVLNSAWDRSSEIQFKRLKKLFSDGDDESNIFDLGKLNDSVEDVEKSLAVNWLANDGVWFQALEFTRGMNDAKRVNDSTWAQFSPFEARVIKRKFNMGDNPGLEGLKFALQHRLYAFVNKQEIVYETENSFVFRMNECRVQIARNRKGLDDYPCKSGGMVEYTTFAETIDKRIKTEVVSCPPDQHPDEYFCAWKFSI
ncbi:MAG: DUF6125 family protein [Saprospiraceae bacterium]